MKKLISLFLILITITVLFAGCDPANTPGNTPENTSEPIDAATAVRLLLASERLDSALLKNEGDIFEQGVEVMQTLSTMTTASVIKLGTLAPDSLPSAASLPRPGVSSANIATLNANTVYDGGENGGVVKFDGEKYYFSDYVEVSNSYSNFYSTAQSIVTMAEDAAKMIDNIKKNVRVVDKWVRISAFEEYYLHVGENEEILYERMEGRLSVCRRYKNEEGLNVYEYYMQSEKFYHRMLYIPGTHFERVVGILGEEYSSDYMIADNTKGYWESYWVGPHPTHYNVSYMVMKDDICYDSFYDPKTGETNFLKIISADKNTDLFYYQGGESDDYVSIAVHFSGYDGIKHVEADAYAVSMEDMGGEIGKIPFIAGEDESKRLVMENGKVIKVGDTFVDGKVEVRALRVPFYYPHYTGEIEVFVQGNSISEKLALYKAFLEEAGFVCRRNIDTVLPGVQRAFVELKEINKHHTWNGYSQATEEGIGEAIKVEDAYTLTFGDLLKAVQDAPVIDFSDKETVALNAHFAPVTVSDITGTTQNGMSINIGSITLSVSDTLLFVENEPYTINFALNGDSGLVHVATVSDTQTTPYANSDSFSVTVSNITLELPQLLDGTYTLVAYIATADGIRSSGYTAFGFDSVDNSQSITLTRSTMSADTNSNKELILSYELITDIYVSLSSETPISYAELYDMIASCACDYGIPSGLKLEYMTVENTYVAMSGEESDITSGNYRLAYDIENGAKVVNGYIYAEYVAASAE